MIKRIVPVALLGLSLCYFTSCDSNKNFKKTKNGLEYKIFKGKGKKKAKVGDVVEIFLQDVVSDSLMMDIRKMNNGEPYPVPVAEPTGKYGDINEGMLLLAEGDSAVFRISMDSVIKNIGQEPPAWIKPHSYEEWRIKVVKIKSKEEADKDMQQKMAEQQQKMEQENAKMKDEDDKKLQEYFNQNKLSPTKTASGLYYSITKPGSGPNAQKGQEVTVNYTGKTMDGKTFDSNVDPEFKHMEPFKFVLGQGQVIAGWDEGVALLNKGSKAKLYIPSPLAYGPQMGVLIFDVEVLNIKEAPAAPQQAPANQ